MPQLLPGRPPTGYFAERCRRCATLVVPFALVFTDSVGLVGVAALVHVVEHADDPVSIEGWGGAGATQPYLSGLVAMRRLVSDLEQLRGDGLVEFRALNPARPDDGQFRGMHEELQHLRVLADRRHAAQSFLSQAADVCDARFCGAAPALRAAAVAYGHVGSLALRTFECRHGSTAEADGAFAVLAAGFPSGEEVDAWSGYWQRADERLASASLRAQMAGMLRRLVRYEEEARGQLVEAVRHLQPGAGDTGPSSSTARAHAGHDGTRSTL